MTTETRFWLGVQCWKGWRHYFDCQRLLDSVCASCPSNQCAMTSWRGVHEDTTLFAWAGCLHLAPFCHKRYTTTTTTSTRYKRFRKFISFTPIGLAAYSHIRNISKVAIEAVILAEVKLLLSMTGHLDYSVKKVPRKNRHNCCYRLCCVWPSQVAHSVSLFILGLVLLILVGALANFFLLTAWLESLAAPYIAIIYLQLVL